MDLLWFDFYSLCHGLVLLELFWSILVAFLCEDLALQGICVSLVAVFVFIGAESHGLLFLM